MASSHRSILALACVAVAAAFSGCCSAVSTGIAFVTASCRSAFNRWIALDLETKTSEQVSERPKAKLRAAVQYAVRQVKRERVVMRPMWRMCPSG